jgi:general stress protein 13
MVGSETRLKGLVVRFEPYGAFLELGGGVRGLIHISELSSQFIQDIKSVVGLGDTLEVGVLSVDRERARVSLTAK